MKNHRVNSFCTSFRNLASRRHGGFGIFLWLHLYGFFIFMVELSTEEVLERIDGIPSRFLVVAILRGSRIEVLAFLSGCNLLKCRCF